MGALSSFTTWAKRQFSAIGLYTPSYSGASQVSRQMKSWTPYLGSANSDYSNMEQKALIARCRDAHRNQALARAAVDRLKHNVVGTGVSLQSHIYYETLGIPENAAVLLEKYIEREFCYWARNCDAERSLTFNQLQAQALVSWMISGDVFINTPFIKRPECEYELKLQIIEADRVSNPNFVYDTKNLRRGVELDSYGAPVAYHIMSEHPGDDLITSYRWDRFSVFGTETGKRRIFHLLEKERPGQIRGVPFLAPVLELFRQLGKYTDAEIMAAVVSSCFTVFMESEDGAQLPFSTTSTEPTQQAKDDEIALGSGAIINLKTGEKVSIANPSRPNSAFDPFVQAILRQIGAALSLPIEFLQLSFMSSYSAARAALLQAWKLIAYNRQILIDHFCQPVYETFVEEMLSRGKIFNFLNFLHSMGELEEIPDIDFGDSRMKHALCGASWIGPVKGAIDENKEIGAAKERIETKLSSRQIESQELLGMDWADVVKMLSQEEKKMKESGIAVSAQTSTKVASAEEIDTQEKLQKLEQK